MISMRKRYPLSSLWVLRIMAAWIGLFVLCLAAVIIDLPPLAGSGLTPLALTALGWLMAAGMAACGLALVGIAVWPLRDANARPGATSGQGDGNGE